MLAIRLRLDGLKKRSYFRVVVTDSRAARDSSFVEVLGHYNPSTTPEKLVLNRERLEHWVKVGRAAVRLGQDARGAHAGRAGGGRGRTTRVVSRARDVVEVVAKTLADHPGAVRGDRARRTRARRSSSSSWRPVIWAASSAGRAHRAGDADAGERDGRARRLEGDAGVPRRAVSAWNRIWQQMRAASRQPRAARQGPA